MNQRLNRKMNRRQWARSAARGGLLAGLAWLCGLLGLRAVRRHGSASCRYDHLCRGCLALAECDLPEAAAQRRATRQDK